MIREIPMPKHPPEAFLLDMDGVLYHGERPLPAASAVTANAWPILDAS